MDISSALAAQTYAKARPATAPLSGEAGSSNDFAQLISDFAGTLAKGDQTARAAMTGQADPHALVEALAAKLGVEADLSGMADSGPQVAEVLEDLCIGCTKCYKVCPTDAILGAAKQIHAVFREACTACGKCVDVCPTEATRMIPLPATLQTWYWSKPGATA